MSTFLVRTLRPDQDGAEMQEYDLEPESDQAQAICGLFLHFLAERPPGFREKLPFINNWNVELEWAAAEGGAALASFFADGEPLSMGILLSGLNPDADARMLDAMRTAVIEPIFADKAATLTEAPDRPLLLHVLFPEQPELLPRAQLLSTALASVFFRVIREMHQAMEQEQGQ